MKSLIGETDLWFGCVIEPMIDRTVLEPGDEWPGYYRGFRLSVSPDDGVWWQLYQGTERLYLDPIPSDIAERLLEIKRNGGRVRITEEGDVLTRIESGEEYRTHWLGTLNLRGILRPAESPEQEVPIRPDDLSPGDLWPSVYDGARFSQVSADNVWWSNPRTHRRHPLDDPLPDDIAQTLRKHKPKGGSFRVLPWGAVITLIPSHPIPERVENQFTNLPRVVRNIIQLRRKEVGLEMLPIFVGNVGDYRFDIGEPRLLSDPLSSEEEAELEAWATSLGQTSQRTSSYHEVDQGSGNYDPDEDIQFDDDPETW